MKDSILLIIKELDTKTIEELDSYFIPALPAPYAIRVILYKFSCSILLYKEQIILHDNAEDLHQFRINIRKSRAFLKEFSFLFPKEQQSHFSKSLKKIASKTNHKRDLDVIKEQLLKFNTSQKMIQKEIKEEQMREYKKIQKMLKNRSFSHFFLLYRNTLKSKTGLAPKYQTVRIKDTAKKVIQSLYHEILIKIDALEKGIDEKNLHKIRISFKKLRYLLEEFQHILGEEKVEKMIKDGKKVQTLLGEFNDTVNQKKLLHNYLTSNKDHIPKRGKLERVLLKETLQRQEKLLLQAKKKLFKFRNKEITL